MDNPLNTQAMDTLLLSNNHLILETDLVNTEAMDNLRN